MDSKLILQQFIDGELKSKGAIAELEKNLSDTSTLLKMQEAARTRYIIGFIRRVVQFKCEEASAQDLCLNLRDLVLVLGRVKLNEKLYKIRCRRKYSLRSRRGRLSVTRRTPYGI